MRSFSHRYFIFGVWLLSGSALLTGCLLDPQSSLPTTNGSSKSCAPSRLAALGSGEEGSVRAFRIDPMLASGNLLLTPMDLGLDRFARAVSIDGLRGYGVLAGRQVEVVNGFECDTWYGAFAANQKFEYSYGDSRFAEAMSYAWGDRYLDWMDARWDRSHAPPRPFTLVARCPEADNAFYVGQSGGEYVCLGISTAIAGANFSDDAQVVVHEMQHGFNAHAYSSAAGLNQFNYDEGGALNEALADAMALIFSETEVSPTFDPRTFSRWALGQFFYSFDRGNHSRGAYFCPTYDPRYPQCEGGEPISATDGHVSYVYPEGLGWPLSVNGVGVGQMRHAALSANMHEIHNNAVLLTGAVWDVYQALVARGGAGRQDARSAIATLVQNAIALLPVPSIMDLAPVTFRGFGSALVQAAQNVLNWDIGTVGEIQNALAARGLWDRDSSQRVSNGWLALGPGAADASGQIQSPGLSIEDNPTRLRSWLKGLGVTQIQPPQNVATGSNGKLNAGEIAALWIDLKNTQAASVGAVLVDIEILGGSSGATPPLTFMSGKDSVAFSRDPLNFGRISSTRAQILYPKIYGSRAVASLRSNYPDRDVPVGTSFFQSDLNYAADPMLALWVQASAQVASGTVVQLRAIVQPSNGPAEMISIPVKIW